MSENIEKAPETPKKQSFLKTVVDFLGKVKFRYSIVMILIFACLFIMMFPSLLPDTKLTKEFWGLINGTSETFKMLLGMAIGFYFNNKANAENNV